MQTSILIVEDDNDINKMLYELLTLHGYPAIQAFSGTEAQLHIQKQSKDTLSVCGFDTDSDSGSASASTAYAIRYKDLTMYPENHTVFVGEEELPLTKREYLILELLMEHPKKVFAKSNIYESVWNEEFLGEDNAVNIHISNIRQKLSRLHPDETYIQTVWGIGFKMK